MTGTPNDASPECGHPANELLDFYVNGSLQGEEAAMVAAHVAACDACARDVRELQSLSEAIGTHGVEPAADPRPGRAVWGWLAAAAALIVVGTILYRFLRPAPSETRIASAPPADSAPPAGPPGVVAPAPAGAEVGLDLGVGTLRDAGGSPPRVELAPGVAVLRLTLAPPVVPGANLRIGVIGPNNEEILPEAALPPYDSMGRVAIAIDATRLAKSGTYQVLVKATTPSSGDAFLYPFEIFRRTERE
jgi:putative zinc finger protein